MMTDDAREELNHYTNVDDDGHCVCLHVDVIRWVDSQGNYCKINDVCPCAGVHWHQIQIELLNDREIKMAINSRNYNM